MKHFVCVLLWIGWISENAAGFIPPVKNIIDEVFANRKAVPVIEAVMQHRVQLPGGDTVFVEEQMVREANTVSVLWKLQSHLVSAQWTRQSYVVNSQLTYPSRSSIFLKYLLATVPEDLLRQLLLEQFVRKDQLVQFKSSYAPAGDPAGWNPKASYQHHPDIFLFRLPAGVAIAVMGLQETGASKTVYFDDSLKGISRIEWKEGDMITAWDFGGYSSVGLPGRYPKRMTFVSEGTERIQSTLVALRSMKTGALSTFRRDFATASRSSTPSEMFDKALKLLLAYR